MPPPDPRSSTVSPACKVASAVGFPHPRDAFTASSGICPICVSSYNDEVIGSISVSQQALVPQQELPPSRTRSAACRYFSCTTSLILAVILLSYLQQTIFF